MQNTSNNTSLREVQRMQDVVQASVDKELQLTLISAYQLKVFCCPGKLQTPVHVN